ncbi:hypothetical protein SNEBB_007385 [Seison nebaliae]|nr:hypothetical protein SNEBB_007385 [Seison nebaliae]
MPTDTRSLKYFFVLSKPLNLSFADYQCGFYYDDFNYFYGLNKLEELSKEYSQLHIRFEIIISTGQTALDSMFINESEVKCEENYTLTPMDPYYENINDSKNFIMGPFEAYDTSNEAKKTGFGFWLNALKLVNISDGVWMITGIGEIKRIEITVDDQSLI